MRLPETQKWKLRRLRVCCQRLRLRMVYRADALTPSGVNRYLRQAWGLAKLEARAAELRGQPHLLAIPLLAQPRSVRDAASIHTDTRRDAILTFQVSDPEPRVDTDLRPLALHQLVFRGVAHLSVAEEFHRQHRRAYDQRGFVSGQAFYELRNSRELRRLHHPDRHRLTHWILYLLHTRVEVFAEDYTLRLGDAVLPLLSDSEPQALTEPAE